MLSRPTSSQIPPLRLWSDLYLHFIMPEKTLLPWELAACSPELAGEGTPKTQCWSINEIDYFCFGLLCIGITQLQLQHSTTANRQRETLTTSQLQYFLNESMWIWKVIIQLTCSCKWSLHLALPHLCILFLPVFCTLLICAKLSLRHFCTVCNMTPDMRDHYFFCTSIEPLHIYWLCLGGVHLTPAPAVLFHPCSPISCCVKSTYA